VVTDVVKPEDSWRLRPLERTDIAALQRFFVANPEYFLAAHGEAPRPDEAEREFDDLPPPEMPYGAMSMLGFVDRADVLAGVATIVSDFIAAHVWHLGLFIVASSLHGSGAATVLYEKLERWMRARSARWVRLGVVQGNVKAERFWARSGYTQVRERGPVEMGQRVHMLRVMVNPLAVDATLDEYLAQVARDRPEVG
jgi:GNAT superfamily N-acetyltransferase